MPVHPLRPPPPKGRPPVADTPTPPPSATDAAPRPPHNFVSRIVEIFLRSNLPIILIVLAVGLGVMAIQHR